MGHYPKLRLCLFRKQSQTFECYCYEDEAIAALNFIRFLD